MSAPVTPGPPLERLEEPRTIADVLRAIDQILEWSINAHSNIGYFATLYKRIENWATAASPGRATR